ncbi:MAG: hypothetical protein COA58_14065 [Bacteroidetes bacterium]|nr:MAG: hypothetical protein COA58_14065 [Bacteroidota bacterium]
MNKHLLCSIFLILTTSLFAQDTLVVDAHVSTQMVWHVNYDKKAYFPTEGKQYRKIYMYFTLGCADGGCSGWDYDVLTQIMHNTGAIDSSVQKLDTISETPLVVDTTWRVFDVLEPYELGRLITPYGTYMRDNSNGFNNNWTHTFKYDVTDYISLLKDSVIIRAKYNGWSAGFSADIKFEFIEGTPQRKVISIQNMYIKGGGYSNSEQFERDVIPAKTFAVPVGTKSAQAKVIVTGHGNNSGSNCGEFCDKDYYFSVNGEKKFSYRMWREDCGAVPIRPQGGTYLYPRANWCPGDKVAEQRWELTPFLGGDSITLDMDIEAYSNTDGGGGSSHSISSTVFFYGKDNYTFDAELNTIMAPSTESEFINYNPSCGEVIVVIKNNSRTPLTYTRIEYGPQGGVMRTGEWKGNLGFEEMDTVFLPPPYWTGIDLGHTQFVAKLGTPNHAYNDDNIANDMFVSNVELVPRWEPIRVLFRSNGQPQENRITITNEKGEVVWELGDFTANTIYDEDISLPVGCYEFLLTDENEDGLDWWVYSQSGQTSRTGGSMRIFKQSGGLYATAVDFGKEFRANFIVGQMDVQEAPLVPATSLDVFPNPSNGKISILVPAFDQGVVKIEVVDRLGRVHLERENTSSDKEYWEVLDITGLQEDLYIIRVSIGDEVVSKKLLKFDK